MEQCHFPKLTGLMCAACLLMLSSSVSVSAGYRDTLAADSTLNDASGRTLNYYTDSNDSISVILFWATWYPYCRTLMPHLQKLADEFKGSKVKFYALNVWENGDPLGYLAENSYAFHLLLLADRVAAEYGVSGTPGLFVMDKAHRILYMRGSDETDMSVEAAVRKSIQGELEVNENQ